jgi:hypothetical protein
MLNHRIDEASERWTKEKRNRDRRMARQASGNVRQAYTGENSASTQMKNHEATMIMLTDDELVVLKQTSAKERDRSERRPPF